MEKTDTSSSHWAELGSDNSLLQESCDDTTQVEIVEKDTDISEVTKDLSNLSLEETLQPRTSRQHGRPPPKFTYDVMGEPTVQVMTMTGPVKLKTGARKSRPICSTNEGHCCGEHQD